MADAQIIVVGTGFGGAVAACRLAQAGFDVLVLERGRRYGPGDFPEPPPQKALLPDFHRWTWQHDQGLWDIRDLDELVSVQAAGFGGGSLIYANVHLRAPELVFERSWPDVYRKVQGKPHELETYYDLAAYMLDVAPISEHEFYPALVKADQLKKAARALERSDGFFLPPLTISREDGDNVHGVKQKACVGCGSCVTGCPYQAKNTLDYNYLALAERNGARIRTLCEVRKLKQDADGWELTVFDHQVDLESKLTGSVVFLAAGSIHTTKLLLGAELHEASMPVQKRVGLGYFPGGDALGVVYDTNHAQHPNFGPTITTTLVHNPEGDPGAFFMLQDGGYGAELNRLIGSLKAPLWVGRNRLSRRGDGEHRIEASAAAEHALSKLRELEERNGIQPRPGGVISGVDDILNAIAADELRSALPKQLVQAWPDVVPEISRATVMRAIVERTIETGLRAGWERFPFVRGHLDESPWRQLLAISRWLLRIGVKAAFGGVDVLATRATYAMLTAGGLNRDQVGSQILGYDATASENRTMLLAMGRDAAIGVLQLYQGRLVADLDLSALAPGYATQERVMTDFAHEFGGELRLNPAWSFYGKPITVHNQGGCAMSDRAEVGVTDPNGAVQGCKGLYVSDGSLFCTSVGVNPSATILAIAERNVLKFIQSRPGYAKWPANHDKPGAAEYVRQRKGADDWRVAKGAGYQLTPPTQPSPAPRSAAVGIKFIETMNGYYAPDYTDTSQPLPPPAEAHDDRHYLERETRGRPDYPISLCLQLETPNLAAFIEDVFHVMRVSGTIDIRLPDPDGRVKAKIDAESKVEIFVPLAKPYAVPFADQPRFDALTEFARRHPEYQRKRNTADDGPPERFLRYCLKFHAPDGRAWWLWGYKRIRNDPGPDAWRATTSLYSCLWGPKRNGQPGLEILGSGVVHVDAESFLFKQLRSVEATGTDDPTRQAWATATFASFFFGSLLRIYQPGGFEAVGALAFPPHVKLGR